MLQHAYAKSIDACAAHYGDQGDAIREYLIDSIGRAFALGNRGPVRYDSAGRLHPDILEAYARVGFYVFENLVDDQEIADLRTEIEDMIARFPVDSKSNVDAHGRPALGAGNRGRSYVWSKPLGDQFGGTDRAGGRYQIRLMEPEAAPDAPTEAVMILLGMMQYSEACLRLYGNPHLLRIAEAINGPDFVPCYESLFIKEPGIGGAVSWHQDGTTHWDSDRFSPDCHGFNIMTQLYDSTPVNGVWFVPGTHRQGKVDIQALVAKTGSERITGAVPLIAGPGDVAITNRQVVHGSFANTGFERRITVNFGIVRRDLVLGVTGVGVHADPATYDDARIDQRLRVLGYALDARQHYRPDEEAYTYQRFAREGRAFHWDANARADMRDYNTLDLSI